MKEWISENSNINSAKTCTEENFSPELVVITRNLSTSWANFAYAIFILYLKPRFPTFFKTAKSKTNCVI